MLLVPRKSHYLPGEKPQSKTPPGRPAKCSKSLLIQGNQPSAAPAKGGARDLTGASDGPVIHITGNLAAAEFLGT